MAQSVRALACEMRIIVGSIPASVLYFLSGYCLVFTLRVHFLISYNGLLDGSDQCHWRRANRRQKAT